MLISWRKHKPNRAFYKSVYWRTLDPLDRAQILLVAEGVKPAAYVGFTDLKDVQNLLSLSLKIFVTEGRGNQKFCYSEVGIYVPEKVYTISGSRSTVEFLKSWRKFQHERSIGIWKENS